MEGDDDVLTTHPSNLFQRNRSSFLILFCQFVPETHITSNSFQSYPTMRCSTIVLLAIASATTSNAFMVSRQTSSGPVQRVTTLFEGQDDEATAVDDDASSWPAFEPSGLSVNDVKKTIARMTKDNFQESLNKIEPYLINESGQTFYNKSLRRIQQQAKDLGATVPTEYVKHARCNAKRREKQNAFIQTKEEERMASEAAAAEEAAAAKAAEEEAAAAEAAAAAETEAVAESEETPAAQEESEAVEA